MVCGEHGRYIERIDWDMLLREVQSPFCHSRLSTHMNVKSEVHRILSFFIFLGAVTDRTPHPHSEECGLGQCPRNPPGPESMEAASRRKRTLSKRWLNLVSDIA